jgi:hypothetical protein
MVTGMADAGPAAFSTFSLSYEPGRKGKIQCGETAGTTAAI